MRMAFTLLFVAFGIPLLTTILISTYEVFNHCIKSSKASGIPAKVSPSMTIHRQH